MTNNTKYAQPEYERRFLLPRVPAGAHTSARIIDRYIDGTRLRLRRIESTGGETLQLKLGHKVRPDPEDPSLVLHTSLYLSVEEYDRLSSLHGTDLTKTRHLLEEGAVDVYEDGTIIHEVEFRTREEIDGYLPPFEVTREVTNEEAYTGFALARRLRR